MTGEIILPGQFNGEARLEPLVVDDAMLYEGSKEDPPVVEALAELLGEEGKDWAKVPHDPSTAMEKIADKVFHIEMFEIEALSKGIEHVRLQRLALR